MLEVTTGMTGDSWLELAELPTDHWKSYHVFYHGERDLQLAELVQPLVRDLLARRVISRFYFVRYNFGGPHLRLRWRTLIPIEAERALELACQEFFKRYPSVSTLTDEQIRRGNKPLMNDPSETSEINVFPNHSWGVFPPNFEVIRYGGESRFAAALDAFMLSSLKAMQMIESLHDLPESKRRAHWLKALTSFAWGLARDEADFISLLGYGTDFMGEDFDTCRQAGDALFERQGSALTSLIYSEMARQRDGHTDPDDLLLFNVGRCVASTVADLDATNRWICTAGHLHMAANRLGLTNAEEVYLGRMLRRAGLRLKEQRPESWRRLWRWRSTAEPDDISLFTTTAMDRWLTRGNDHEG